MIVLALLVAFAFAQEDLDNDGVVDSEDVCNQTQADVLEIGLNYNRWMFNGTEWITPLEEDQQFDMKMTKGCSCLQIVQELQVNETSHERYGCSAGLLEEWIATL